MKRNQWNSALKSYTQKRIRLPLGGLRIFFLSARRKSAISFVFDIAGVYCFNILTGDESESFRPQTTLRGTPHNTGVKVNLNDNEICEQYASAWARRLRADVSYFLCFTRKRKEAKEIGDVCSQASERDARHSLCWTNRTNPAERAEGTNNWLKAEQKFNL